MMGVAIPAPDLRWKNSLRVEVVLADLFLFPFIPDRRIPDFTRRDFQIIHKENL